MQMLFSAAAAVNTYYMLQFITFSRGKIWSMSLQIDLVGPQEF